MLAEIQALLADGSNPLPHRQPPPGAAPLFLARGGTATVRVRLSTPTGAPVPVGLPSLLGLTVKRRPSDAALLRKTAVWQQQIGPNVADFQLASADTRNIQPGRYLYDVWFTDASGSQPVVRPSALHLAPAIADLPLAFPAPPLPGPFPDESNTYSCDPAVLVGDAVYLASADTVNRAEAGSEATSPAIGFVFSKQAAALARVQWAGELAVFSGLVSGETYYLALVPGQITAVPPVVAGQVLQRVGFARNTTTLVIEVDQDFIVL